MLKRYDARICCLSCWSSDQFTRQRTLHIHLFYTIHIAPKTSFEHWYPATKINTSQGFTAALDSLRCSSKDHKGLMVDGGNFFLNRILHFSWSRKSTKEEKTGQQHTLAGQVKSPLVSSKNFCTVNIETRYFTLSFTRQRKQLGCACARDLNKITIVYTVVRKISHAQILGCTERQHK